MLKPAKSIVLLPYLDNDLIVQTLGDGSFLFDKSPASNRGTLVITKEPSLCYIFLLTKIQKIIEKTKLFRRKIEQNLDVSNNLLIFASDTTKNRKSGLQI